MATPSHVVLRSISGPGGKVFQPGEQVHALDWRHVEALVAQGRLRPILATDVQDGQEARPGRYRKGA